MDFFWRQGLTNKACTDTTCSWNRYGSDKEVVKPTRIEDIHFRKPGFGKVSRVKPEKKSSRYDHIEPFSFDELFSALGSTCPDAVVFQTQKTLSPDDIFEIEIETSPKQPFCEMLKDCTNSEEINEILNSFTDEDVNSIERETRGQSGNALWKHHRVARITASIAHDVASRMKTLQNESSKRSHDPSAILKTITKLDSTNLTRIPQIKYGKEMEDEARKEYEKIISTSHKYASISEVGLIINKDTPQYGASPDGIVSCRCCNTGLLEIKCPLSVSHTKPSAENLPYLVELPCRLSEKHKYYSQVQWQMGICQKKWCDFFVYSRHGYYLERVNFNQEHFDSLMYYINAFYNNYVIPTILAENQSQSEPSSSQEQNMPLQTSEDVNTVAQVVENGTIFSKNQFGSDILKANKKRKTGKKSCEPIYLCGKCSHPCLSKENIKGKIDNSVQCEVCFQWFHFMCASFDGSDENQDQWFCENCV